MFEEQVSSSVPSRNARKIGLLFFNEYFLLAQITNKCENRLTFDEPFTSLPRLIEIAMNKPSDTVNNSRGETSDVVEDVAAVEPFWTEQDYCFMELAIELAKKAEAIGEIPVGAVLVHDGKVIGKGFNQAITLNDPTAHAEVMALRDAGSAINNYRLVDTTLYVTLEPCVMCSGSLVHARVGRVIYGAKDYKTGAVESVMRLLEHESHNHKVESHGGLLENRCSEQLSAFFKRRRAEKKRAKQAARQSD